MTALDDTFRRGRAQRRDVFHRVFSVVGLIGLSGCGYRLVGLPFGQDASTEGSLPYQIFASVIYLIGAGFIFTRPTVVVASITKNIFLFCLFVLAISSLIWSQDLDLTVRRVIALTGTMFFAMYLAMRFDEDESMKVILWAMGLIAVFSLFVIILFPKFGIHPDGYHFGKWRGLYGHKNALGREMALAAILFFLFRPVEWNRLVCLGISAICLVLVLFSKSAQGQILVAALIPAGILLRPLFRLRNPVLLGSLVLMLVGTLLLAFLPSVTSVVFDTLGRDETLTGRTKLWGIIIEDTSKNHPLLGYGYTGTVQLANSTVLPGHAHNGYIQLFSELGMVGVILFCLTSLIHWKNAIIRLTHYRTMYSQFLIIYSIYFYFLSVVASPILAKNSVIWLLFVFVALKASDRRIGFVTSSRLRYGNLD